jgi:hypothetical protein
MGKKRNTRGLGGMLGRFENAMGSRTGKRKRQRSAGGPLRSAMNAITGRMRGGGAKRGRTTTRTTRTRGRTTARTRPRAGWR